MKGKSILVKSVNDHIGLFERFATDEELKNSVIEVGDTICSCLKDGGAIYLFGNGGSAADAQHIATEFVSRFYKERKALNAEALSVNNSSITAIANDYAYDLVFARQLEAKGRSGDVAIGISTSGKSANVIRALDYAHSNGIRTILLTSFNCQDEYNFDYILKIPSYDTPRIQEMHIFIGHIWAECVEERILSEKNDE